MGPVGGARYKDPIDAAARQRRAAGEPARPEIEVVAARRELPAYHPRRHRTSRVKRLLRHAFRS